MPVTLKEETHHEKLSKEPTETLFSVINSTSVEEITQLIQGGADVNAVDEDGKTSLMLVAENNSNPYVLRVLIENGADINAYEDYG